MPNAYRYPDPTGETTNTLVAETESVPGGWDRAEELVLGIALGRVAGRFRGAARCLDAGAGDGRLTRRFGTVCRSVTALELDPSRLDRSGLAAHASEAGYEVSFEVGDAAEMDTVAGCPFDTVVLSHVMQHAPRETADEMLAAAARALQPGGILYVSVPVSDGGQDEHVLARVEAGRHAEDPLDPADFDRLCLTESGGRLPTRKFALHALLERLAAAGFRVDDVLAYHFRTAVNPWPPVPLAADVRGVDLPGVIDVAVLATRS